MKMIIFFILLIIIVAIISFYCGKGRGIKRERERSNYYKQNLDIKMKRNEQLVQSERDKINNEREELNRLREETNKELREMQLDTWKQQDEIKRKRELLEKKFKLLDNVASCSTIFEKVATMYADFHTVVFDDVIHSLVYKDRPAPRAAEAIKEFKHKANEACAKYKLMSYKYEFLINQFPQLRDYVDDYEAINATTEDTTIEDAADMHDRVKDWISDEEYRNLDVDSRNQLALDNYLENRKLINAQIGYEYELYIGYRYRENNWNVEQFGIERGLEDLGRDIIAQKIENGRRIVHIVQCKRWSEKKEIHENVVNQLFGTTVQYRLSYPNDLFQSNTEIIPVLITTTALSETAQRFADYLKVKVYVIKMGDYPRIKCNINKTTGEKIYHLPFDQQYYTTKIDRPGEFFAFTVKEATSKGFRRAFRHTTY